MNPTSETITKINKGLWIAFLIVDRKCCWPVQSTMNVAMSHCNCPQQCTSGDSRWRKTGHWPRELRHTSKEWFPWAQTLASSHTQKSTKIINLRCLFFVISSNIFMFDYMCFVLFCFSSKNSYMPLRLPYLFGQFLRVSERLFPRL